MVPGVFLFSPANGGGKADSLSPYLQKCYHISTTTRSTTYFFLQIFGAVGYAAVVLLWLWTIVLWMPTAVDSGAVDILVANTSPAQHANTMSYDLPIPSFASILIAIIATVASIIVAIYFAMKLPGAMVRRGSIAVHQSSELMMPKVVRHNKVSKKKRQALSAQIIVGLKACISLAPLLAVHVIVLRGAPLSQNIVWLVAGFLSCSAAISFGLQWILARIKHIDYTSVW